MKDRLLQWIAHLALRRRRAVLAFMVLFTSIAVWSASHLTMNFQWIEMLPEDLPTVSEFQRVYRDFSVGHNYMVVVTSDDPARLEAALGAVEERVAEIHDQVQMVIAGVPESFMLRHGAGTLSADDFRDVGPLLTASPLVDHVRAINDLLEDEYAGDSDQVSEDEREVVAMLRSIGGLVDLVADADGGLVVPERDEVRIDRVVRDLSTGNPRMVSLDGKIGLVMVVPQGDMSDFSTMLPVDYAVEVVLDELAIEFPDVVFERTGMIAIGRDELDSLGPATWALTGLAFVLAFCFLAWSFRSLVTPVLATFPLAVGIVWSVGFFAATVESLNVMTATIMVVLVGLGIDFSIHLVGRYGEERKAGVPPADAIDATMRETGSGVVTGALTTAAAFFGLMVAKTPGTRELGFCAGSGVILTLLAVMMFLPVLLVWKDSGGRDTGPMQWIARVAVGSARHRWPVLGIVAVTVVGGLWLGSQNAYEYNLMELEPAGLRSVELQTELVDRFGLSLETSLVTANDVEECRRFVDDFGALPTVGEVDAISLWIPDPAEAADIAAGIATARAGLVSRGPPPSVAGDVRWRSGLAEEFGRLRDNVIELGDLAFVSGLDRVSDAAANLTGRDTPDGRLPVLAERLAAPTPDAGLAAVADVFGSKMWNRAMVMTEYGQATRLEDLPTEVVARYRSEATGRYLVSVMPREFIYEREALVRFDRDVHRVHPAVVGMPQLILTMNDAVFEQGTVAVGSAACVIFLILLADFRRIRTVLLAMTPLVVALAWLFGAMKLLGIKFNLVSISAFPILIGIGVDDGVHFVHRMRILGASGLRRTASGVGRAVFLTSVTTMAGFGSIGLYAHRGMASLGRALTLGVGAAFIATIVCLPPLLRFIGAADEEG